MYKNVNLDYVLTNEGRIVVENNTYKYQYFLKDHLGNTRVTFDEDGVVKKENDYYPFGLKHSHTSFATDGSQKYLYNGKELQDETGWLDYGWRMYDPALGRWHCADPAAELAHNWTPYRYGFNNPILFKDAYGLWEETAFGWTTSDLGDIERFLSMLRMEFALNGDASLAQVDQFITEEFNGSGGKLSNGSVLLSEATAYGDGQGNWGILGYQMNRMRNEVSNYRSFAQNLNNFVGKYSFYSYKYYRERSWQQRDGNFPGLSLTGFAADQASSFLSNSKTWVNITNMKSYSNNYFGINISLQSLLLITKHLQKNGLLELVFWVSLLEYMMHTIRLKKLKVVN